jgi:uncharacterized integral membrane protein
MVNLWLKIKIWTKIIVCGLVLIYLLMFFFNNANKPVKVWVWINREPDTNIVPVMLFTLAAGIVGTLLVGTAFRTIKQIRELQNRTKVAQQEKEMAELRAKAAMLKTKPEVNG